MKEFVFLSMLLFAAWMYVCLRYLVPEAAVVAFCHLIPALVVKIRGKLKKGGE